MMLEIKRRRKDEEARKRADKRCTHLASIPKIKGAAKMITNGVFPNIVCPDCRDTLGRGDQKALLLKAR